MHKTDRTGITAVLGEEIALHVIWLLLHASFQTKNRTGGKLTNFFLIAN